MACVSMVPRRYAFADYKTGTGQQQQYVLYTVRPYRPVQLKVAVEYPFDTDRYPHDCLTLLRFKNLPSQEHDIDDKARQRRRLSRRPLRKPITSARVVDLSRVTTLLTRPAVSASRRPRRSSPPPRSIVNTVGARDVRGRGTRQPRVDFDPVHSVRQVGPARRRRRVLYVSAHQRRQLHALGPLHAQGSGLL